MASSLLVLAIVAIATLLGDYCIKVSTAQPLGIGSRWFIFGMLFYGLPAVGWFYLMQSHSLALLGVLYSASTLFMLAGLGYFVFKEPLAGRDVLGLALAFAAVTVMSHD